MNSLLGLVIAYIGKLLGLNRKSSTPPKQYEEDKTPSGYEGGGW